MQLARVIGTVVATVKNESLEGRTLLVVQTLNKDLQPSGKPLVAVDSVGAGIGELVFWCRGKEASFPFKREDTPTDCTIIGIVDSDAHVTNTPQKIRNPTGNWAQFRRPMILARVLGNIVATKKNQRYDNASVMLCQQITPEGDETATTVLALNSVDAGVGDTVLIVQEGWSASTAATGKPGAAIDSAIVGVVDRVDLL